jgi:DNA-directed RNA polymerase specialized sigma24 family protein
MEEVVKWLKALVFIQLQSLNAGEPVKPEVLLSKAGLAQKEIAEILGKSPNAVKKTLQRARAKSAEGSNDE